MFLRPHTWVDVPYTVTERRRVLNVRESKHTAMVWDKKYYNIDTGKYDTDKLHTINSCLLSDMIDSEDDGSYYCFNAIKLNSVTKEFTETLDEAHAKALKKDEEIRQKKILKELEEQEQIELERQREERIALRCLIAEERRKLAIRERALKKKIKEKAELRTEQVSRQPMIYIGGPNHGKPYGCIITKQWK